MNHCQIQRTEVFIEWEVGQIIVNIEEDIASSTDSTDDNIVIGLESVTEIVDEDDQDAIEEGNHHEDMRELAKIRKEELESN